MRVTPKVMPQHFCIFKYKRYIVNTFMRYRPILPTKQKMVCHTFNRCMTPSKMAVPIDVRQKQRAVIEFLTLEKQTVGDIHKRLQMVYGDDTVDRSTVGRWAKRTAAEKGHADVHNRPRCGRPQSA